MTAEFDDLFRRLGVQTQRLADGDVPVPNLDEEPVEVEGSDPDELIRIRLLNGMVTGGDVHPAAMKAGSAGIGDLIKAAVNAAIDAHMAQVMAKLTEDSSDFAQMTNELKQIQLDSLKSMDQFSEGIMDVLRQASRLSQ